MILRGVVRTADLQEYPAGSDQVELLLSVQGVGAGQPRRLVIPFALLLQNDELGPDEVKGRGFEAEAEEDAEGRWVVSRIAFASKVLRPPE